MKALFYACLLLISATPTARAAEMVSIDWGKSQRFELQRRIEPGQVLEVCGPLAAGQGVDWQFVASGPVGFNIHHHVGKRVFYAERRHRVKSLTLRFEPREAADYCWMWTAPAEQPAVSVQMLMRR